MGINKGDILSKYMLEAFDGIEKIPKETSRIMTLDFF
jgi:hypothetical protein